MRRLRALLRKEATEILRQRELLFLILAVPLVEIVVLGFVLAVDVRNIPVRVIDESGSAAVPRFAVRIGAAPALQLEGVRRSGDAMACLVRGEAKAVVTIRKAAGARFPWIDVPEIQIFVDGSDAVAAQAAAGALGAIARDFVAEELAAAREGPSALLVAPRPVLPPDIAVRTLVRYNPDLRSVWAQGPGLVGLLLTFITFLLAGLGVVREREQQTLDTLLVSRLRPIEIFLGKGLVPAAAGLAHLAVGIPVLMLAFKVPFRGSAILLLLASLIYLVAAVSLALGFSAASGTQQQAMFLTWYTIMTVVVLSGFFTPLESMLPEAHLSRAVATVNPFRYLMRIVRAVMLKGAGPGDLAGDFAALAGLAVLFFAGSYAVFRRALKR
jgi:ABC-2 type transport system permease protein